MGRKLSHALITEPALGGLRVVSIWILALMAGCAAPADTKPDQPPKAVALVDRTAETEYRLDAVAEKLTIANRLDAQGQREASAAILSTAREMLPANHSREKAYLDVLLAAVWGRGGEGRDAEKAEGLLRQVLESASDFRLTGDGRLAEVAIRLGAEDLPGAVRAGEAAEGAFALAEAWSRLADARRELAAGYMDYDLHAAAVGVSRRGAELAEKLQDDARILRAWLDVGSYTDGGQPAAMDEAFLRAYYAAYRVGRASWRNAVIATAVDKLHQGKHHELAARWGDRIRDADGLWPNAKSAGLQPQAHAALSAQYALSLFGARPKDSRVPEALKAAEKYLVGLDSADEALADLAGQVRAALLQIQAGK